jgi:nitrogen fixation/metabolism regulation signal transduction histidine kinase
MSEKRKKVWIDRFQTHLFWRIAAYFVFYQVAVWSLVAVEHALSAPVDAMLGQAASRACFLFLALAVVVLGVVFIYDAVVFTHRIVGPLYRLRQVVRAVAAGEELELITLRKGDYLQEFKDDFNAMLERLEERGAVVLKVRYAGRSLRGRDLQHASAPCSNQ